ncbi:MAG: hypothetical protein RL565_620 [Pseudomonadota bacterium]|jgi:hypothetical protein
MKKLCMSGAVLVSFIAGCASNEGLPVKQAMPSNQVSSTKLPQQGEVSTRRDNLQNEIAQCVEQVNDGQTAKAVDGTILVLNPANPSAKFLYSSPNKLTGDEAELLSKFKRETQKCRQISRGIANPALRKVYQNYFSKIDRVYDDLIYKKITIGVANQERSLLISQFKSQWLEALNK